MKTELSKLHLEITFINDESTKTIGLEESKTLIQQCDEEVTGLRLISQWEALKTQTKSEKTADSSSLRYVGIEFAGILYDIDRELDDLELIKKAKTNFPDHGKSSPFQLIVFDRSYARSLEMLRHSTAHVLAHALQNLFPKVTFAIGPATADGYYYDIDLGEQKIGEEDLSRIEKEMKKIASMKHANRREVVSRSEAMEKFSGHRYKEEILTNIEKDSTISVYHTGNFTDLCQGPHISNTKSIKHIKLQRVAGAYWRGNEKNPMLTRIYGTAFWTKNDLQAHLKQLDEAKLRDHNRLGRTLGLFQSDEAVGQGLPLLTPRGTVLFNLLRKFVEQTEEDAGYQHTLTPYLAKSELYKISGHWQLYKDGMFVMDNQHGEFALRPMTCPFHFSLYNAELHSYRELPVRLAETSTLFRNEASGEMHGLIRVRQFTLADGHIICREDQIEQEFEACIDLLKKILNTIGLTQYTYRLSKWDPAEKGKKYVDNQKAWNYAENKMRSILKRRQLPFVEAVGEAAFYGPKLDIQMRNVFGKEDTILTVQIDFAMPERFNMFYIDQEDKKQRPYVIHRSSIGCYERTIALLIEHYAGKFPFWMSITQVAVLSIDEASHDYAHERFSQLKKAGFRVKLDIRRESLGKKIRKAGAEKTPILLTVGKKERETKTVSLRTYNNDVLNNLDWDKFIAKISEMEAKKSLKLLF